MKKPQASKIIFYPLAIVAGIIMIGLAWPVIVDKLEAQKWQKFATEKENTPEGKILQEKENQEEVLKNTLYYPGKCGWFDSINTQYVFKGGIYFINNFCLNENKSQSINEFYSYNLKDGFTELLILKNPTWVGSGDSYIEGQTMYKTYDLIGVLEDSKLVLKSVTDRALSPNRKDKDVGCGEWSVPYNTLMEFNNQLGFYVLDPNDLGKGIHPYKLPADFLKSQQESTFPCQLDRFGEIRYGN